MITPEEIKATLAMSLPVSLVETQDLTGGGDHWQLIIVSPAFEGKGLLEQRPGLGLLGARRRRQR